MRKFISVVLIVVALGMIGNWETGCSSLGQAIYAASFCLMAAYIIAPKKYAGHSARHE